MSPIVLTYVAAFAGAVLCAAASLPLWRRICQRTGLMDDPGHRKIHHGPIPLAGGLSVMTGLALPLAACALGLWLPSPGAVDALPAGLADDLKSALQRHGHQLAAILAGAAGMLGVGLLDDRFELRPAWKFGGQLVVAALVATAGVRITLFVPSPVFSYAVTMLWILTVINAFNFMDNMNGLCGGLAAIAALEFGASAALSGQSHAAAFAFLIAGAVIGFLPRNYPRATAFLGDAGSHLLGYLLAVLAILPHFYSAQTPHRLAVLKPLLILAVPLMDLAWVVCLRWKAGRPFYVGDTNHLSHRLVRAGLTPSRAVPLIWLIAAALGALALL